MAAYVMLNVAPHQRNTGITVHLTLVQTIIVRVTPIVKFWVSILGIDSV